MIRKQLEIEPEKFQPQYKVHKIFRVGVKLGSVEFPETTNLLGLNPFIQKCSQGASRTSIADYAHSVFLFFRGILRHHGAAFKRW